MKQEKMLELAKRINSEAFDILWEAKKTEDAEKIAAAQADYETSFNLMFVIEYPALARFQGGAM
jgi:hypothetical protein